MENKMEQDKTMEEIRKQYDMFNIPEEKIPAYENPYQFAKAFKKCSTLLYKNITYSDSTTQEPLPNTNKEDQE